MSGFTEVRRVIALLTGNAAAFERVAEFMATVSRIEADATLSAHRRAREITDRLAAALRELSEAGQLTKPVEAQLTAQTEASLDQLGQMTEEFGDRLAELARAYRAPEAKQQGARLFAVAVLSIVVFLFLIALGVGPLGVLLVLIGVAVVGWIKFQITRD